MRIGVLVENDAPFVSEEVAALRAGGARVEVAAVFRPASRWQRAYAGPVHYPAPGVAGWARWSLPAGVVDPSGVAALARVARAEGAPLRLVALAADLARRARREGWTHLHGSFASFPAWTAWAAAALARRPFSFTGHAYDLQRPRPWVPRLLAGCSFARAISEESARRLRALAPDADAAGRVRLGTLGVDLGRFEASRRREAAPPEVVSVARLVPKKGLAVLIDAAGALARAGRPLRLRILGDGPERGDLERRVRALGAEGCVRFEGGADREQVAEALARAAVFALPCVLDGADHDGIPVALLEAMASGLPVVTTPVGGIPEVIEPGRNGCLVPSGDPAALAGALAHLLDEPRTRRRLGTQARATVESRFSLERSSSRLAAWIAEGGAPAALPAGRLVSRSGAAAASGVRR